MPDLVEFSGGVKSVSTKNACFSFPLGLMPSFLAAVLAARASHSCDFEENKRLFAIYVFTFTLCFFSSHCRPQ